jgi:cytochrome P450
LSTAKYENAAAKIAALVDLPLARYRELRARQPVTYDADFKSWNVYRYADALRILNDASLFSSEARGGAVPLPSIVGMDGGRHRKLRSLVTQAFTPRVVEQLAPRITEIAGELLEAGLTRGRFDAIRDFAYPLPMRIIAELLGVPVSDQSTFRRWSETLVAGPRTDARRGRSHAEERIATLLELKEYLAIQLAARRASPGSDLISRLLAAEVDGERLQESDLLEFCRLLLIAGYETTACQIGTAVLTLHELPELAAELRAEPTLLPGAVEEIVRCFPSVAATVRVAMADVELGGEHIGKGQSLVLWTGSINYDEETFADPETIDIRRSPNRHLGFGQGPHFCLGAPLARLELRIALTVLLQKLPRIHHDQAEVSEPVDSPFLMGVKHFTLLC